MARRKSKIFRNIISGPGYVFKARKRRSRKPKDPELVKEYYERTTKVFNTESGSSHPVFVDVKPCQQIDENTPHGVRVLVAKYPNFYKIYFHSFYPPGEPGFPRGGVKVWNTNIHKMQTFYSESVAIHPDDKSIYKFECFENTK